MKNKGINLTVSENKAMHSLQTLMTQKGYYEQCKEGIEIPIFEFTPAEYLETYGVKRHRFKDGRMHFSVKDRQYALQSLVNLANKKFYIYEEIASLLDIIQEWEGLTDKEIRTTGNNNNKLIKIGIKPHKILVDQIDKHFVMKPTNYLKELTNKYKRVSKFMINFLDLLFTYVALNTNTEHKIKRFKWIFERGCEEIAINIWLTESSYWRQKKKKKLREIIIDCYEKAKGLGYIEKYEVDVMGKTKKLDRLYLNKNKYYITKYL